MSCTKKFIVTLHLPFLISYLIYLFLKSSVHWSSRQIAGCIIPCVILWNILPWHFASPLPGILPIPLFLTSPFYNSCANLKLLILVMNFFTLLVLLRKFVNTPVQQLFKFLNTKLLYNYQLIYCREPFSHPLPQLNNTLFGLTILILLENHVLHRNSSHLFCSCLLCL